MPLALVALGLSACTAEAGLTVPGEDLADLAADALEEQTGARPDIDCGDDSIIVSQDKEVDCTATSTETGAEYDTVVTFTSVDGREYEISVEVASEPNGAESEAPTSAPAEDDASEPAADAAELQIAAEDLASAVADALVEQLGSRPEIDCGKDITRTLHAGAIHYCELIDASTGEEYNITITITGVEGSQFNFSAEVSDTPN
nr:DUF4333 domain-containing protein [Glycomyces sp. L485]